MKSLFVFLTVLFFMNLTHAQVGVKWERTYSIGNERVLFVKPKVVYEGKEYFIPNSGWGADKWSTSGFCSTVFGQASGSHAANDSGTFTWKDSELQPILPITTSGNVYEAPYFGHNVVGAILCYKAIGERFRRSKNILNSWLPGSLVPGSTIDFPFEFNSSRILSFAKSQRAHYSERGIFRNKKAKHVFTVDRANPELYLDVYSRSKTQN